jgi:protein phosphatase
MPLKSLSFAMLSDRGRVRQGNEDACAANPEHGIFVVCDGVGGAAGGEIASRVAADAFVAYLVGTRREDAPDRAIQRAIFTANRAVLDQAGQTRMLQGMATTMVAMLFDTFGDIPDTGEKPPALAGLPDDASVGAVWLANVGDSRCYRLRGGLFEQLTHDHSIVAEQVRAGEMTLEQAELSPVRNVITRAIGSETAVEADLQRLPAERGDLYLLTSDGLMKELKDEEIAAILSFAPAPADQATLSGVCEELVRSANAHGGGDNITCVLVYVH